MCIRDRGGVTGQFGELGGVHRVGGHHRLPLRPFRIADFDRDRRTERLPMSDAGQQRHLVGLEFHPRATAGTQSPAGQRLGHLAGGDPDVRRNALDGGHQSPAV